MNLCKDCKHCVDRYSFNAEGISRPLVSYDYLCTWPCVEDPVLGTGVGRDGPVSCWSRRELYKTWRNDGENNLSLVCKDCPGWEERAKALGLERRLSRGGSHDKWY